MAVSDAVKIRIENLSLSFGGVKALTEINLDIRDKEILAIIGPNGAGETCLLSCINGFYMPQYGEIFLEASALPVYARTVPRNSDWRRAPSKISSFTPV